MNYLSYKSCDVNLKSVGMTLKDEKDEDTVIAKKKIGRKCRLIKTP